MTKPEAIRPVSLERRFVRVLVYGDPGVGKSVLAGTSENALILANDDDETSSAAVFGSKADVWVIRSFQELTEAVDYLRHEGHRDYDWVWLDNGTLHQEQIMDEIMEELSAANSHRSQFKPDKPQYGETQQKLGTIVRQIKTFPMHFGMTAHAEMTDDPDTGSERIMPMFQGGQGKFSSKLQGYFGMVGRYTVVFKEGKTVRKLYVVKRGKFHAKDRYHSVEGGIMTDPTMPKIMEGIGKKLPHLGQKTVTKRTSKKKVTPIRTAPGRRTTTKRSA